MKRFLLTIAILLSASPSLAEKTLKIGTEGAYFPFNYIDEKGQLQGFDIELSKALCDEMKAKCTIVAQDWDGIIPGLLAKKYDAIIALMAATEQRRQQVDFTEVYYASPVFFAGKKKEAATFKMDTSLNGKTIGVQRGTTHARFVEEKLGKTAKIKFYDNQDNLNMDLKAGRVDYALAESAVIQAWMNKPGNEAFGFLGPRLDETHREIFGHGANIAVRKDDKELKESLNKALAALRANGKYAQILKKFVPAETN